MPDQRFAEIIAFAHEAGHLKHTPRTGWLLGGVRNGKSVAAHSYRVAVLAYVIAAREGANPERAATLGLFHDLPETRIGDVPTGKALAAAAMEVPPGEWWGSFARAVGR